MLSTQLDTLEKFTQIAKAIAWDECHKIYVLMDYEQVDLMRSYGYDPLITADEMSPAEMTKTVLDWYEQSCGLRFIDAVNTDHDNPNKGFVAIVSQFDDYEEEE